VDLVLLWSPCPPEEAAVGLFVQAAFVSLANAGAAKDKDLRCGAIRTIVRCVQAFGQRVNAVTAAMGLLHQHEHSSGPMAELVATAWEAQETSLVSDVLREIGRIPMAELSRDTGAARNIAAFLTELSELTPAVILMHMSVLNPHLQQGESYMMRNAILHAIGYTLVELVSIVRKERSDTAIKTRESLLQVTHMKDERRAVRFFSEVLALMPIFGVSRFSGSGRMTSTRSRGARCCRCGHSSANATPFPRRHSRPWCSSQPPAWRTSPVR
jgi:hypothetical protein